ncbi:MAG: ROK family protein [Sphaerimonospora mesophila]
MFISIDVGGTNTRVAGATDLANPVFNRVVRRRNIHDFEKDMAFMVGAALAIADGEEIEAVGIGAPGLPNADKTAIEWAENLKSWNGRPLAVSLREGLGAPVFYDSDEPVAALGEVYYGPTRFTPEGFDYLIWGTGIGGARVKHGNPPLATQLDWRTYFVDWENDNGGAKLTEKFRKAPEDFTDADWAVVAKSFERHLGDYIEMHRPRAIVFGGGLAVKHTVMIENLGRDFGTQINVTKFGGDSGLMGGFGLIRNRLSLGKR